MKITPLDIRRKEFRRSMRGYSDEEVDIFLDEVADEFERLFQENIELQDRVQRVEEQIATYAQVRDALEKTLISAQVQSEEIKANANRESELILRDAQLKARSIVNDSYGETQQVQKALVGLKRLEEEFRFKFRSLLEGYLNLLNEAPITTTTAVGAAALGGDAIAATLGADQAAAPVVEAVPEVEAAPEAEPAEAEAAPEVEVIAASEAPQVTPGLEPSEEYEEEIPTEETEMAVAEAEPVEELVAEAEEAAVELNEAVPPAETVAEAGAAAALAEAAVEEEAAAEEMVPGEMVAEAETVVETVADAIAADAIAADTTATDEVTLETSAGSARPEDDQTDLDDSRHGFFFGRQLEDIDDTFPGEDVIRKDRTRDFEW